MDIVLRFIKTAVPAGLFFAVFMGVFFGFTTDPTTGIRLGIVAGVLFGLAVGVFSETQRRKLEASAKVFENEPVVFQGPANHFLNREGRGGWLTLTATRLAFRSHGKNLQNQPLDIDITSIAAATACNTAFIVPNGLKITLRDGSTQRFVVGERKDWMRLLAAAVAQRQN